MDALGVLGGTFDPVHHGHLRLALEFRDAAALREVRLVPVGRPAHRDAPLVDGKLRARMLRAAVAGVPGLAVDERELTRAGPSYTVETLAELRREYPQTALCLIIGMDQFVAFDQWHEWRAILELAHLCVAERRDASKHLSEELAALMAAARVSEPAALKAATAGRIFVGHLPLLDISSTRVRRLLADGRDVRFLLPPSVLEIIKSEHIYDYDE